MVVSLTRMLYAPTVQRNNYFTFLPRNVVKIKMPHHWIPNSSPEIKESMMKELGISHLMELFSDIPKDLILKEDLNIGFGRLSEYEVRRLVKSILNKNRVFEDPPPFLGGGLCAHYVPSAVKAIVSRSEFYTAYTPYQPEIAQGILQAFFEYQSLLAELYGVDIVNASMYNGSTAAAEAVRMAARVKKGRKTVLIAGSAHPEVKKVIGTWVSGIGLRLVEVPYKKSDGTLDTNELSGLLSKDVAALYVESPNFYGAIEKDLKAIIEKVHEVDGLAIVNSNPLSLSIFKPPGDLGADIVVGDAQPLGLGLNYGGPSAGIFGIKDTKEFLRQLPGRLIGMTKDMRSGDEGFMMVLQTREQHIRRERATSNITTNSGLEAVAAAVFVSLLGSDGLRKLGEAILGRTHYLLEGMKKIDGVKAPLYPEGIYFGDVPVGFERMTAREIIKELIKKGIHIGPPLSRFYKERVRECLMCVSELHTRKDIDKLLNSLNEVISYA